VRPFLRCPLYFGKSTHYNYQNQKIPKKCPPCPLFDTTLDIYIFSLNLLHGWERWAGVHFFILVIILNIMSQITKISFGYLNRGGQGICLKSPKLGISRFLYILYGKKCYKKPKIYIFERPRIAKMAHINFKTGLFWGIFFLIIYFCTKTIAKIDYDN
jgi:hypothetical protein